MDIDHGFTFTELCSIKASNMKIVSCHFSADGKWLATAGHDRKAVLWYTDVLNAKSIFEGHSSLISDVRFSPCMPYLATSSFDNTVRVWDAGNPRDSVHTFRGHSACVVSLDFHPNRYDLICSCDGNGEIRFWSVTSGNCEEVFRGGRALTRFQPRLGKYLAAAEENVVSILDVETHVCCYLLQGHVRPIHYVCWDPSGGYIASISEDIVRIWTFGSGNEGECIHELRSNGNKFYSCVFHPTNPLLLIIGCYQDLVISYRHIPHEFGIVPKPACDCSSDGLIQVRATGLGISNLLITYITYGIRFQSLEIWNMTENKTVTIPAHGGLVSSLAVSTATRLVASTSHDTCVKLWI